MTPVMHGGGYAAQSYAPRGVVRHAYPLTVTSASFTSALVLNLRTLPYAIVRFFAHLVHAVVAVAMVVASISAAIVVGQRVQPYAGIAVFFAGISAYFILWAWWFRYLLYGLKCAHVAVLTDLITRGKIGSGSESMLGYGRHVVSERVGDIAQLYGFQMLLRLVMIEFTLGIGFLSDLMPFGIGFVARSGRGLIRAGTQFLDETLFSYSLVRLSDPLWDACSEGLGYYFQNSKEILKTTVWMVFVNALFRVMLWIVFGIVWGVMLYGVALSILTAHAAAIQAWAGPDNPTNLPGMAAVIAAFGSLVFTGFTASAVNHAFLRPICLTMIITKFLNVIQSQPLAPGFEQYVGSRGPRLQSLAAQIDANRSRRR